VGQSIFFVFFVFFENDPLDRLRAGVRLHDVTRPLQSNGLVELDRSQRAEAKVGRATVLSGCAALDRSLRSREDLTVCERDSAGCTVYNC